MKRKLFVVSILATLSGCAQMSNYRPAIDTYGDPRVMYLQQDMVECQQIASQNASVGKSIATDGLTGALIGGAGGAALGALFGDPAIGAAAGGAAMGLGGAAKGGFEADDRYKRIYRNCLRGRGHRPLD